MWAVSNIAQVMWESPQLAPNVFCSNSNRQPEQRLQFHRSAGGARNLGVMEVMP